MSLKYNTVDEERGRFIWINYVKTGIRWIVWFRKLVTIIYVKLVYKKKEISSMIYQVWSPVQSLYNISYEWVIEYECNLHNIATLKNVNVHTWEIKYILLSLQCTKLLV